jgi:hypothetical protein
MATIAFRSAVEADFNTAQNFWKIDQPAGVQVGDFLIAVFAAPSAGGIWSSPGWNQVDAFSTVDSTLAAAQNPAPISISYAVFTHFVTPADDPPYVFPVLSAPTAVIGAAPGSIAGVALTAAYENVSQAVAIRNHSLLNLPPLTLSFSASQQTETAGPFNPVSSAVVPDLFANVADFELAVLATPGWASLTVPTGYTSRLQTANGSGIAIALADISVVSSGLQTGADWTGTTIQTPLVTHALSLWPDNGYIPNQTIDLYTSLDLNPAEYGYVYSQEPRVIANSVGYLLRVWPAHKAGPRSLFSTALYSQIKLLLTRPDGTTQSQDLTLAPDGYYAYCTSGSGWFPYTGRYYLQLQLTRTNGAVEFSSQMYLEAQPQGGQ